VKDERIYEKDRETFSAMLAKVRNDLKNEIRAELDEGKVRYTATVKRVHSLLERLDTLEPS
jgi:hypothetical protein